MMLRARLPIVLLSLTSALPLAATDNIDKLAGKCRNGNQQACARLAEIAKTSIQPAVRQAAVGKLGDQALLANIANGDADPETRRAAFRRLIAAHACSTPAGSQAAWRRSENVSLSSHLFFAEDVPAKIETRIQDEVRGIVTSALRDLGLTLVAGDTGESVIEVEAFGTAESASYMPGGLLYTGARWEGAISLRHDGCLYCRPWRTIRNQPVL